MIGQKFDHKGKPKTETHNAGLTSNVFYAIFSSQQLKNKKTKRIRTSHRTLCSGTPTNPIW